MSIGRPRPLPGYPSQPALYPVSVRRVRVVVPAPFRFRLTTDTLSFTARFRSSRPPEDFHLLQTKHAWQTKTGRPARNTEPAALPRGFKVPACGLRLRFESLSRRP